MKLESKDLLKLPTDKALVDDPAFRKYVELYAKVFCSLFYTIVLCMISWLIMILNCTRMRMHFSEIMQHHTRNYLS